MDAESRRLLIARHGETDSNLVSRFAGWNDDRLTGRGREQVLDLATRLRGTEVRRIYTSPVRRAAETADILSAELGGLDVRTVHDLHEIELGGWKGLTEEEVQLRWPEAFAVWRSAPDLFVLEGREPLIAVQRRALSAVDQIGRAEQIEPDLPALVVTHLAIIRVLWLSAVGHPLSLYHRVRIATGDVRALRWHGRGRLSDATGEGWARAEG